MKFRGVYITIDKSDTDWINKMLTFAAASVSGIRDNGELTELITVMYDFCEDSYKCADGFIDNPDASLDGILRWCTALKVSGAELVEMELPEDEKWETVYSGRGDLYEQRSKLREQEDPLFEMSKCYYKDILIKQVKK